MKAHVLRPDRQRHLQAPFSWMPTALVCSGVFAQLSTAEKLLYCFLCLVADRRGLSYWSRPRLAGQLSLSATDVAEASQALCERDLIAFDGAVYQVLSFPVSARQAPESPARTGTQPSPAANRPQAPSTAGPPEHHFEQGRQHVQQILAVLAEQSRP